MTETRTERPPLQESVEIAATPAEVWALVTDLPRMARWSPQVVKTFVKGPVGPGTRFRNINRRGLVPWSTKGEVVRFEPYADFAFRIIDNYAIWSFALEETPTGTRVTQRRELPDGIAPIAVRMIRLALGGSERFTADLAAGMRQTLAGIKATAER